MPIVPQWTERITNTDVVGEDHLGVETAAINYQGELLPGIITVTEHARYYSFYCWILWRFIQDERHNRKLANLHGPYFKRLELAHTIACYAHHQGGPELTGVIGSRRSGVIWREGDPIDLDRNTDRYFQNKLGGLGQYYLTPMRIMGLIGEQPSSRDVYQLTKRGLELAKSFESAIEGTRFHNALKAGDVQTLSYEHALDFGKQACLCSEALAGSNERALLREMLFRIQDGAEAAWQHRERRLSLALLLDMVRQSGNHSFREVLRHVLYLGHYAPGNPYFPTRALQKTYAQWQHVQARQLYTSALQIMWHIFLDFLQSNDGRFLNGIALDDFIDWLEAHDATEVMNTSLLDIIYQTFEQLGISPDWRAHATEYSEGSRFKTDALTAFDNALGSQRFTVSGALSMMCDVFLRFFDLHASGNPIWQEMAVSTQESHRLPMQRLFNALEACLENRTRLRNVVQWVYEEYILSQHEYMAIRKLRYNRYDTFKFHYIEGRFYPTSKAYDDNVS